MSTKYIPMFRQATSDSEIASDWYYSQSECHANNPYHWFVVERQLVEHFSIGNIAYCTEKIAEQVIGSDGRRK